MRAKMTCKRLEQLIEEGRGIGTGDQYLPWIQITRSGTSKTSNQSSMRMPCLGRRCCFLSQGERYLAHVLWWAGALDVREQFPLWPWPHANPYSEVDCTREWSKHPGMIEVARGAGIRLYPYPGMKIPAVLTIDLLVTIQLDQATHPTLLGISCKPQEQYVQAQSVDRLRERLELDRRYCQTAGIKHVLLHPEQLPSSLPRQLEWLAPRATRAEIETLRRSNRYEDFVSHLTQHACNAPVSDAIQSAKRKVGWSKLKAESAARTAFWLLDVDANPLRSIEFHEPLHLGGRALKQEIRRRIFGEATSCN
jgi:hypothetical protein